MKLIENEVIVEDLSIFNLFKLAFESAKELDYVYQDTGELEVPTANVMAVGDYLTSVFDCKDIRIVWESRDVDIVRAACCTYYDNHNLFDEVEKVIDNSITKYMLLPGKQNIKSRQSKALMEKLASN